MPAICPPDRPLLAKLFGLGRPAAVAEGLLEDVPFVDVGLVLVLAGVKLLEGVAAVADVRVDETVGDVAVVVGDVVCAAVGFDEVLSGGAVEGADSAESELSCVLAGVLGEFVVAGEVSVGEAVVESEGVAVAVSVGVVDATAVDAAGEPLLLPPVVALGVALGVKLCPGVVYKVPKSSAGKGPVYNNGTFTTV